MNVLSPSMSSVPTTSKTTDRQGGDCHPKHPVVMTQGDPCGIGPEIIAKAFASGQAQGVVVLGDPEVMKRAVRTCGLDLTVQPIDSPESCYPSGVIPVLTCPNLPSHLVNLALGQVHVDAGRAAAACIRQAIAWAREGRVSAIVTAPIHKEALALAGEPYPGHTELLQAESVLLGQSLPPVRMMLANDQLKTVLLSIHVSLRDAIEAVTFDNILQTLRITRDAAQAWGLDQPRIGVAGLNPHAGEGGLFGREEIDIIEPAVRAARAEGIDARGPYAPDTIYMRARHAPDHAGEFDVVLAMYHDQGLIPVKYMGLEEGVNVTLGLPFIRTSPDHGTAFDLAGTGQADPSSLMAALQMARQLSCQR